MSIKISKGVQLMLIASIGFALMNVSVKTLHHIPVFEVILFRAAITLVLSYLTLKKRKVNPWGTHHKFLIARGLFGSVGLICYFYTLQKMALANAIVIHYLSPIFTTLVAMFFLNESVRVVQWLAFAVSFGGVVMVKGFSDISGFDFLIGVCGAMFSGFAYNAIRNMRDKEDADVIVFYHPLISLPVVFLFMLFSPQNLVMPHGTDWLFLIGTGVFTQIGQYYITRAYQNDTAARVSAVSYIGIIWGVLFGKFLFGDSYKASVLSGMCVVLAGVLLNINSARLHATWLKLKRHQSNR